MPCTARAPRITSPKTSSSKGLYGRSELGETSFERLSGNVELLTDDDRQFSYYNVSVGYNVLPGEAFVGRKYAFRGGLYLDRRRRQLGFRGRSAFHGQRRLRLSHRGDRLARRFGSTCATTYSSRICSAATRRCTTSSSPAA